MNLYYNNTPGMGQYSNMLLSDPTVEANKSPYYTAQPPMPFQFDQNNDLQNMMQPPEIGKGKAPRGRKIKKEPDESGHPEGQAPVKKKKIKQEKITEHLTVRKKRDRFNGKSEDEVLQMLLPDHLKTDLDIVIVGINPGLFAAYKGHHYAGPGNHFWKCLFLSGLIPEQMNANDDFKMMDFGIGFTNIVSRTSRGSSDLTRKEIKEGGKALLEKLQQYKPKIAVFNGKGIYEIFCGHKNFAIGKQPDKLEGTETTVFVMPSSSARCSQLPRAIDKVPFYVALRKLRDHLIGNLPDLDEAEICFPDLELKVVKKEVKEEKVIPEEPNNWSGMNQSECTLANFDQSATRPFYSQSDMSFNPPFSQSSPPNAGSFSMVKQEKDFNPSEYGMMPSYPNHPSYPSNHSNVSQNQVQCPVPSYPCPPPSVPIAAYSSPPSNYPPMMFGMNMAPMNQNSSSIGPPSTSNTTGMMVPGSGNNMMVPSTNTMMGQDTTSSTFTGNNYSTSLSFPGMNPNFQYPEGVHIKIEPGLADSNSGQNPYSCIQVKSEPGLSDPSSHNPYQDVRVKTEPGTQSNMSGGGHCMFSHSQGSGSSS